MKMKHLATLLTLLMVCTSCKFLERLLDTHYCVFIQNTTEIRLMMYGTYTQQDTLLPYDKPNKLYHFTPASYRPESPYHTAIWESYDWTEDLAPTDTIRLFIFEREVIENVDWETIRNDYMVLHRYDFSKADLDEFGWHVSFPPDERMRNVRMWPSYEEVLERYAQIENNN